MSVATKNPFALLDAEDTAASAPPPASSAPAETQGTRGGARGGARGARGGPAARGGKYYPRGGAAPQGGAKEGGAETAGGERPKRTFDGEGRGRGRGRGEGRGEGRGRGGRREDRQDRHSATGKIDSDKKVHQSWGGDNGATELKVEEAAVVDAANEGAGDGWGAEVDTSADAWGVPATAGDEPAIPAAAEGDKPEGRRRRDQEDEEEDNTLTFDQYLAQKAANEASALPPKPETRQVNDDGTVWKDATKVVKGEGDDEAYFATKTKSAPKAREKKEKVFLDIDARFEPPSRGGRGGRGHGDRGERGSRPGRGRGGAGRGRANGNAPNVNVDDETAFPSLS